MSEPLRHPAPPADGLDGRERDARVEQLLVQGLDDYFAGRYEQAINVWTRVLFLDRGHARARAYIERARSAEAERQRESEELLHRGVAAFDEGDTGTARTLLTAAADRGVATETALAYLGRLERLGAGTAAPPRAATTVETAAGSGRAGARRAAWLSWPNLALAVAGVAVLSGAVWFAGVVLEVAESGARPRPDAVSDPGARTAPAVEERLPLPRAAELALERARLQFLGGHARDALRTLATISPADPARAEADRLQAEIQRALLATVTTPPPGASP